MSVNHAAHCEDIPHGWIWLDQVSPRYIPLSLHAQGYDTVTAPERNGCLWKRGKRSADEWLFMDFNVRGKDDDGGDSKVKSKKKKRKNKQTGKWETTEDVYSVNQTWGVNQLR